MNAHLHLLDCFRLVCEGRHVALPMSAQRLMAFLALHPHPLRRVHVAGALWLDSPEERAFASLRSALWRLQAAGGDLVETCGGQLGLHPSVRVDFRDATCVARALLEAGAGAPGPAVEWGVLAGELLPDWDDDWVIVEREHHRHLSLQALEALSDRLLATGASAQALEIAVCVFAREPLRETRPPAHGQGASGGGQLVRGDPPVPPLRAADARARSACRRRPRCARLCATSCPASSSRPAPRPDACRAGDRQP